MTLVQMPGAMGELVDRRTIILGLKQHHLAGEALAPVKREYRPLLLEPVAQPVPAQLQEQLRAVNAGLWQVEEAIHACDARGHFGPAFVALAQQVYRRNDQRTAIKLAINRASGSTLVGQKSYTQES